MDAESVVGFARIAVVMLVITSLGIAYEIWCGRKSYANERKRFNDLCDAGAPPNFVPIETDWWSGSQRVDPHDVVRTPSYQKHLEDCREIVLRTKKS